MKRSLLHVFFLTAWLGMVRLPGAGGQDISVSVVGNQATFGVGNIPNLDRRGNFKKDPFQQIFWIFGDGDYRFDTVYPGHDYENLCSHNYLAPVSKNETGFIARALVIDRKTDNPPSAWSYNPNLEGAVPPGMSIPVSGNGLDSEDDYVKYATPLINNFADGQRIKLISSHYAEGYYYVENGTQTAFVVAFSPMNAGKLLFFYNDDPDNNRVSEFTDAKTIDTRYGNEELDAPNDPADGGRYGDGAYNKVIEYTIPHNLNIDKRDNGTGIEELRLFYLLTAGTINDEQNYPFMVVLASEDQDDFESPGSANLNSDVLFVSNYVDEESGKIRLNNSLSNLYFVDADIIYLKGGEPIDPNHLRVTHICKCSEDYYQVSFTLSFRNTGTAFNRGANIIIRDNSKAFDCIRPADTNPFEILPQKKSVAGISDWRSRTGTCPGTSISYRMGDIGFCITGYELGYSNGEHAEFRFTARTNSEGLKSLLSDGALAAYVEFHEKIDSAVRCTSLAILTGGSIWRLKEDNCATPCEPCCETLTCRLANFFRNNSFGMAALLGLLAVAAGFYLWRRRVRLNRINRNL